MALIFADRVQETTTTTGTGTITLNGASSGYSSFNSQLADADTCYYAIESIDSNGNLTGEWEVGLGTYQDPDTLERTSVLKSSNSNSLVNFGSGTKRVFLTVPAEHIDNTYKVVQVAYTQSSTVSTGTTTIPTDGTIPQNTEGTEFLTCTITPKFANSKLLIQANVMYGSSAASVINITTALFRDSTANAIAAVGRDTLATANAASCNSLTAVVDSGSTSATTFKIRIGGNAATTITFNGYNNTAIYGAIGSVSSLTITEYLP